MELEWQVRWKPGIYGEGLQDLGGVRYGVGSSNYSLPTTVLVTPSISPANPRMCLGTTGILGL